MATEFFLVLRFPIHLRQEWLLRPGEQTVGRLKPCDICISDDSVSRNHAKIFVDEDKIRVVDRGSLNGTSIEIAGVVQQELAPVGSIVQFGRIECLVADRKLLSDHDDLDYSTRRYQPNEWTKRLSKLSTAQRRVLPLLVEGLIEKEIANRLGSSIHTIHHHIDAIRKTFGVTSHTDLLAFYVRQHVQ